MCSSPPGIEQWWLTTGLDQLAQLVDIDTLRPEQSNESMLSMLQRRLRAFDGDQVISSQTRENLTSAKNVQNRSNPRRQLTWGIRHVFKKLQDGGLDHRGAVDGLTMLESVETRRLQLVEATTAAVPSRRSIRDSNLQLIEVLHHSTTEKYRSFQLGLRVYVRDVGDSFGISMTNCHDHQESSQRPAAG